MDSTCSLLSALIGAIIGGLITYFATLLLNREQLRSNVRVSLYERLNIKLDEVEKALTSYESLLFKIGMDLEQSKHLEEPLWRQTITSYVTTEELSGAHRKFQDLFFDFSFFLGQYDVAVPSFKKFRAIIGGKQAELSELHYKKLSELIRWALPFNRSHQVYLESVRRLDPQKIDEVQTVLGIVRSLKLDIVVYFDDLSIYAQNELLGKLFGRSVSGRQPTSAKHAVIEGNGNRS